MNHAPRISLTDTPISMMTKLAEGNPGALTVLISLFKQEEQIDPDSGIAPYGTIMALDDMAIYGSHIWVLYKDVCKQSILDLVTLFRAHQLGFISRTDITFALAPHIGEATFTQALDLPALLKQVQERLPAFGQPAPILAT